MTLARPFEVYFDFDNTITDFDVLDDIIQRFSINDGWKRAEEAWEAGDIGSRECLERQLSGVRVSEPALEDYLRTIRVDPGFKLILELLGARGIAPVILSDSFSSVIRKILDNNSIYNIQIFANDLRLEGETPVLAFPYFHSICSGSGNCKCSHLYRRDRPPGTRKIYIGDGRSDICPAGSCEILFAKGALFKHYAAIRKDCIPFENLGTVYSHLQRLLT